MSGKFMVAFQSKPLADLLGKIVRRRLRALRGNSFTWQADVLRLDPVVLSFSRDGGVDGRRGGVPAAGRQQVKQITATGSRAVTIKFKECVVGNERVLLILLIMF